MMASLGPHEILRMWLFQLGPTPSVHQITPHNGPGSLSSVGRLVDDLAAEKLRVSNRFCIVIMLEYTRY